MTKTVWRKKVGFLKPGEIVYLENGYSMWLSECRYGYDVIVKHRDGNVLVVTSDLSRIERIFVH